MEIPFKVALVAISAAVIVVIAFLSALWATGSALRYTPDIEIVTPYQLGRWVGVSDATDFDLRCEYKIRMPTVWLNEYTSLTPEAKIAAGVDSFFYASKVNKKNITVLFRGGPKDGNIGFIVMSDAKAQALEDNNVLHRDISVYERCSLPPIQGR